MNSPRLRVLVADDNADMRNGICKFLSSLPDIDISCQAVDGADAVRKARKYKPDIVLLDVAMPKVNGLVAARIIKAELPATRIVMLSMHASPAFMREAFTAGASAYVLKENAARELPAQMRGLQEDPIAP